MTPGGMCQELGRLTYDLHEAHDVGVAQVAQDADLAHRLARVGAAAGSRRRAAGRGCPGTRGAGADGQGSPRETPAPGVRLSHSPIQSAELTDSALLQ